MRLFSVLAVSLAVALSAAAQSAPLPYIFSTYAGAAGTPGIADGPSLQARFNRPWGLVLDAGGNLYVADAANHTVRKITPAGHVTTVAGKSTVAGYSDGPASDALFGSNPTGSTQPSLGPTGPLGLGLDLAGHLYVTDTDIHVLRKIAPTGLVSTHAGVPNALGATDGPATAAQFKVPLALTALPDGTVFVADTFNHTIRRISSTGTVTTIAGQAGVPGYVETSGTGGLFLHPSAIAAGANGELYVADANNIVRRLTPPSTGQIAYTVTTVAGAARTGGITDGQGAAARFGLAPETLSAISVRFTPPNVNPGSSGNGGNFTIGDLPGLAVDGTGNVYVTEYSNHTIRRISPSGLVTTIGGIARTRGSTDGLGPVALFANPTGIAADSAGNLYLADSSNHTIRKGSPAAAPAIIASPVSRYVTLSSTTRLSVSATGLPLPVYQWTKDGTPITGATTPALIVSNLSTTATYSVTLTNDFGTASSPPATLTVVSAPAISSQPPSRLWFTGETVSLSVTAADPSGVSYQWQRNGTPIPGATAATLTLTNAQPAQSGAYTVTLTNVAGSLTSAEAELEIASARSRIANLSVRSALLPTQTLTVGFVVNGTGKPLLIRAIGPALRQFGLTGVLPDPTFTLYTRTGPAGASDNWDETPLAPQIAATAQRVGAFTLPAGSLDAAALTTVSNASLTVEASDKSRAGGIVLLELYDAAPDSTARLVNVSTRATAGTGNAALVAGFVVTGPGTRKVLVRAIGPSLAAFGVPGALADPMLEIFAAGATVPLATNDNWRGDSVLSSAFTAVGAFSLSSSTSRDAALLVTLPPGNYSAQVTGVGGTTGEVLLEVYEHP